MDDRKELFRIGTHCSELFNSRQAEIEFLSTVQAMAEMDIFRLPFDEIDLEVPGDIVRALHYMIDKNSKNWRYLDGVRSLKFNGVTVGPPEKDKESGALGVRIGCWSVDLRMTDPDTGQRIDSNRDWHDDLTRNTLNDPLYYSVGALIVMLATKNAERRTEDVKAKAKAKPGSLQATYRRVTTITGRATMAIDKDGNAPTSGRLKPVRPHLRRGHIRNQKHGPGLAFEKKVWIAPVIVNVEAGPVEAREAYNVSM